MVQKRRSLETKEADLLASGGNDPGPEALSQPHGFNQAQRRQRIWRYHRDVLLGLPICFISRAVVLESPEVEVQTTRPDKRVRGLRIWTLLESVRKEGLFP